MRSNEVFSMSKEVYDRKYIIIYYSTSTLFLFFSSVDHTSFQSSINSRTKYCISHQSYKVPNNNLYSV